MGGLAALAREAGHKVTGCDAGVYPPMSDQLRALGIELIEGFGADQLALQPDMFVVGNVVSRARLADGSPKFPLMEAILDAGLPYTSGPQWLAEHVLQGRHVLAVAGTHGKTTTTSMLAWILESAGQQPGFLIGGVPLNFGVSARLGAAQRPALFTETTPEMRINREEIFGPVVSIQRVKGYDEALALANDTPFGLASGIATTSLKHATHFKRHAQAGMVMVNLPTAGVDYHVPFGGRKGSSYGSREQGRYAAEFYTTVKTAYIQA